METKVSKTACCSCGHCEEAHSLTRREEPKKLPVVFIARMAAGIAFLAAALLLRRFLPERADAASGLPVLLCFAAAWLCIGGDVLLRSCRNIRRGQVFDENFLMSVATIGAFVLGEYTEAVAVMLFYQIGECFQEAAVQSSRRSIRALLDIRPAAANLLRQGEVVSVPPAEVAAGDTVIVRCGERVPLDGTVSDGVSLLDMSALTGESMPVETAPGAEILAGAINQTAVLTIRVTKPESESAVARILRLVEHAQEKKARVENFITKFARYYTPAVVFAALAIALLPPLALSMASAGFSVTDGFAASFLTLFNRWVYRALVFLVVSCPCALVISVPLSFFAGLGCASRGGILIKGSSYMEALAKTDTIVFDKTGTLTKGVFTVSRVVPENGFSEDSLLFYTANAEAFSTHPAALSICQKAGNHIDKNLAAEVRETAGQGVSALVRGKRVEAGNRKMMERAGVVIPARAEDGSAGNPVYTADSPVYTAGTRVYTAGTRVYTAIDGVFAGYFVITDELKADAKNLCPALKTLGVRKIAMLTGDMAAAAAEIARETGIDDVHAELLPQDKLTELEKLDGQKAKGGALVFVGDGINDAPSIARADVGIAMGALGSDAAIEAADVVLMTDDVSRIAGAIRICRKTRRIVTQNIIFALGVKGVILVCGALGLASIWMAVFGDVGVALIAVLNAMRAAKTRT